MKTEQEQIKAIKQIIDERVETTLGYVQGRHDNVIKTVDTIIIARDIVEAGYGDVSEYKAEIERLRAEFKELETNAEILARGVRDLNHENYELTEKVKQVQIDILNKLKDIYGLYYLSAFGVKERMLADILNPMIEELKK